MEFDTLDTPEFFWDYEETEPLYQDTRPRKSQIDVVD